MSKIQTNTIQHTANGAAVFTLPQTDGSSGQYLKTDGSGALSFGTVGGGGKVLQVVSTTKTDYWTQATSSNTAFYDITNLSATITPTTSGNKILIFISLALTADQATQRMGVRTVVSVGGGSNTVIGAGTTNNPSGTSGVVVAASMGNLETHRIYNIIPVSYNYLYTTSSTSAHLFRPQVVMEPATSGILRINRNELMTNDSHQSSVSTITLMEIAQ